MNRFFLTLGIIGVLTYCIPTVQAKAINTDSYHASCDEVQPRTAGLIYKGDISASSVNGDLCINGSTISNSTMKTIGIKDIVVERSTDNENWSYYKSLDDMLESSSNSKYVNNYKTSVEGGYYYRVRCKHYAKEKGLFGSSQSVENYTDGVWVD